MFTTDQSVHQALPLTLGEELLREAGELRFVARGSSMLPVICPGDEIIVRRASLANIHVGDVVLFRRDGRWFVHRVRQIRAAMPEPYLITQGDALTCTDGEVGTNELLGRVETVVRNGQKRALSPAGAFLQSALRFGVRYVPLFATACLRWQLLLARCTKLRHVFTILGQGKSSEPV